MYYICRLFMLNINMPVHVSCGMLAGIQAPSPQPLLKMFLRMPGTIKWEGSGKSWGERREQGGTKEDRRKVTGEIRENEGNNKQ